MLTCRLTARALPSVQTVARRGSASDSRWVRVCLPGQKPAAMTHLGLEGYATVSRETWFAIGSYAYAGDCGSKTVETCR